VDGLALAVLMDWGWHGPGRLSRAPASAGPPFEVAVRPPFSAAAAQ